jgi:predicted PurR-regulated permease PerM
VVAVLDLIPLAGATLAAILASIVAFLHATTAESSSRSSSSSTSSSRTTSCSQSSTGRTVLSPLAVLISILIGAELAGVLGALGAIPVAGSLQVLLRDWLANCAARTVPTSTTSKP